MYFLNYKENSLIKSTQNHITVYLKANCHSEIDTVKPLFSNVSVLEKIGFRTKYLRILRLGIGTKIRNSTKPRDAERIRIRLLRFSPTNFYSLRYEVQYCISYRRLIFFYYDLG